MGPIADWILEEEKIKSKIENLRGRYFLRGNSHEAVTRFAFYPDGALHLGHARTIILNAVFTYLNGGEFLFIFDDTEPKGIESGFYRWVEEDLKWLGIVPVKILKISDNLPLYYKLARTLIEDGKAYLCNSPPRRVRGGTWHPSANRGNSIEKNLELYDRLLEGIDTSYTVRFKMPYGKLEEKRWRIVTENEEEWARLSEEYHDWVMLRSVNEPHPLKPEIKIWPTMHFSVCCFDNFHHISHVIRGVDHASNVPPQKMFHHALGTPPIVFTHNSKIRARYSRTSAIKSAIDANELSGWDDPRCFTLRALKRRGYLPGAIWCYILSLGKPKIDTDENRIVKFSKENIRQCNKLFCI